MSIPLINSGSSYYAGNEIQDEINQIQLTGAVADFVQTANAITRYASSDPFPPPPFSDRNLIRNSTVLLDDDANITQVRSISFESSVGPDGLYDTGGVLIYNGVPVGGGGGGGDVNGPASSLDQAITRYNGTTGKVIQDSKTTLDSFDDAVIMKHQAVGDGLQPILRCDIPNGTTTLGFYSAVNAVESAVNGTYMGYNSGYSAGVDCSNDTFVGNFCGTAGNATSQNTGVGSLCLRNLVSGTGNNCFGVNSGSAYTTNESNNICIDNDGVVGESNTIRIGDTQTKCFVKGVYQATGAGASEAVTVNSAGQLSSTTLPTGNVVGPSSAKDNAVVRYDTTTGKLIQDSNLILYDGNATTLLLGAYLSAFDYRFINTNITSGHLFMGRNAGPGLGTNINNTSVFGTQALTNGTASATSTTAVGTFSLNACTSGNTNTAIGSSSLANLLTGTNNVAISNNAGLSYTGAESFNICIANNGTAGDSRTIRLGSTAQEKVYISDHFRSNKDTFNLRAGYFAGNNLVEATAIGNILLGRLAGNALTTQNLNTIIGINSGQNLTGSSNTILGSEACDVGSGTSGFNAVLGSRAGRNLTTGGSNTLAGYAAGTNITTGGSNTILGLNAGTALISGNSNIIIGGSGLGNVLTTGSSNIYLGGADAGSTSEANTLRIANTTRSFISGISGVTTGGASIPVLVDASGQLGTISSSKLVKENIRDIEDTSFIHSLGLKNFEYINSNKQKHAGLIAEELELIKPELIIEQANGIKTVDYQYLFICGLKQIQELKSEIKEMKQLMIMMLNK